ncbi:Glycosyltransferase-like 1B [Entomortierella beljakovae]|nr:Glycosyltransferase-like 1B [Entomortierella beljakovae]
MIAQFTISRLERFELALVAWKGPLSAVMYLTTEKDIIEIKKYFGTPGKLDLYESVTLTIVKPDFSSDELKKYPINHLRNIAILTTTAEYIYLIDVDFVPSVYLYDFAKNHLVNSFDQSTQQLAYVVPCLAIIETYKDKYPDTIKELQPLMKSGIAYITDPRLGHGPTYTRLFINPTIFGSQHAYEVCYESQWEPYYILRRGSAPYYDERFKNQGGDKQSHAFLLNALGFKFLVLRDHFMYHIDPNPPWTGEGLIRNESDYSYFSDYGPAMEKIFGKSVRWPRGCSRPLIISSRLDLQGIGTM